MNARVAENSMTGKSAETISHNIWRDGGAWARRFIAVFTSLSHKDRGAGAGGVSNVTFEANLRLQIEKETIRDVQ